MGEKNWVCWNADFDVALLMGIEFPDAHDAAADVKATVSVMRWVYDQAQNWASR